MKQYVKRWAAVAVVALGAMSAQAKAASVAINVSAAGVNLVVHDDKKVVVDHHRKLDKRDHREMDRRRMEMEKRRMDLERQKMVRRDARRDKKIVKFK